MHVVFVFMAECLQHDNTAGHWEVYDLKTVSCVAAVHQCVVINRCKASEYK